MGRGAFLYAMWAFATLGLFLGSTFFAYSPFADGGRAAPRPGFYGPTHK
ncbi:MAG: hypothetical protein ACXWUN_02485 [Allosphingosinicella sp.]